MTISLVKALLFGDDLAPAGLATGATIGSSDLHLVHVRTLNEACRLQRQDTFHVLLLNLDEDAAEQIEMIRRLNERIGSIPIVVLSGSGSADFAIEAVRRGAQDVLPRAATTPDILKRTILTAIERKRLEQDRVHHARKDRLTGLANRLLLEERFDRAIARAGRQSTLVALVAIDIDQPEDIVAEQGPDAVDHLLPMIGERLTSEIRETDTLARTREAGFTWLVEGLASVGAISVLVERLPRLLSDPFECDGRDVQVTVSVGVAVFPFHGRDFSTLLKMAEAAMTDVATLNGDGLLMPPVPQVIDADISAAAA